MEAPGAEDCGKLGLAENAQKQHELNETVTMTLWGGTAINNCDMVLASRGLRY